ncbi:SidA/IucD/PvdA family monooxygenase [Micromonospora sp. DT48]|uniref:SidA/IucD/PvdA family monooxygenase n=1 Tax=unclassified Micromonospora TaxID=2617518 RepID=UPI0012BC0185|nr:SidA/IucD/PvdA family monooxygenase [Micromonospora sp. CP22]MTK03962.1 cupin domain-containing protein [Micromonospora sp. CP22]
MNRSTDDTIETDILGIGLGPANLSFGALHEPVDGRQACFLEAAPFFQWHAGMMVPEGQLQVSFLKDLVTTVDPTSKFTFLNYLAEQGTLHRFLIACATSGTYREEFEKYYRWSAERLSGVRWGHVVERVEADGDRFEVTVRTTSGEVRAYASTLVLGTGKQPYLPPFAAALRGRRVMHSSDLMVGALDVAGKDVLVVGGGQSGGEVVDYLLSDTGALPASLTWLSKRSGFQPLDDSPFTNEWFFPDYVDHFYALPRERRESLLKTHRLASDGISESTLRDIYRRLYYLDMAHAGQVRHHLRPACHVEALRPDGDRHVALVRELDGTGRFEVPADVIVFCTGYRGGLPAYLAGLDPQPRRDDGQLRISRDYRLDWGGPESLSIYVQNAAEHTHGIADPNLSLAAWRSARIINAIYGRQVYDTEREQSTSRFGPVPTTVTAPTTVTVPPDTAPAETEAAPIGGGPLTVGFRCPERSPGGMSVEMAVLPGSDIRPVPFHSSRWEVPPGAVSDLDVHEVEEIWMVGSGRGRLVSDDDAIDVAPGDMVFMPSKVPHQVVNTGTEPLRIFSVWW